MIDDSLLRLRNIENTALHLLSSSVELLIYYVMKQ